MAYIDDIDETSPNDDPDQVAGGAAQFRQFKTDVKGSFPSLGQAAVTKTAEEINSLITADSTETLTNKTIDNATFTGTQTGFVGDVTGDVTGDLTGNSNTSTLANNIVGQGTLATRNTVNSTHIDNDSVRFSNEMASVVSNGTFTVTSSTPQIIPSGVFNIGAVTNARLAILQIFDGVAWVDVKESSTSIGVQVTSDGGNARLIGGATSGTIIRYRKIFN